jgi:hypothetical protein
MPFLAKYCTNEFAEKTEFLAKRHHNHQSHDPEKLGFSTFFQ